MGVLVAVRLECGARLESAGGRSVVQGGEEHMGDEVSKARGDPECIGEDAVGAGVVGVEIGAGSAIGLDPKLSCGVPESDVYDCGLSFGGWKGLKLLEVGASCS